MRPEEPTASVSAGSGPHSLLSGYPRFRRETYASRHGSYSIFWAAATSSLIHAGVILLAIHIGSVMFHHRQRPAEELMRVTLVEPFPLGSDGQKSLTMQKAEKSRAPTAKPAHKMVKKNAARRLSPAAERGATEPKAEARLDIGSDHEQTIVSKRATTDVLAGISAPSNGGANHTGAATGIPGGIGDQPIPADQAAFPPLPLKRVTPVYPMEARLKDVEGEVVLEVIVGVRGSIVGPIKVKQSIPLLDQAAIEALKQWRFSPARDRKNNPIRVILDVPLRFVLD